MRRLLVVILAAAGLWMGYWAVGSIALERALNGWVEARRDEGWAADLGGLDVRGFPNRFDTILTDVAVADPETGVAWRAEFLQLLALAYRPTEVIAVLPPTHRLSTPLQGIEFTSDRTRGSIYLGASTQLPLDRSTVVAENLSLSSTLGWQADLDEARFATASVPVRENAHRVGAEITGLRLPEALDRALDPVDILPDRIARLRLDAEMGFTAPWDRRAIEVARPQITDIDLADLSLNWGDVLFEAAGTLSVDEAGIPEGRIDLRAVEWRRLLDMAVSTGIVDPALKDTFERGLGILAALSGRPDTIDAPLTFRGGLMAIGPVPIGPAPRIVIR
ncbi:DUF2125 domain-containing protein [Alphaproteobacteria bacterium GH1-50]|uniref:DUF2125 domain-containing protein n=1 Tax=Kangsaoukella pontilimi TaxID=2691042 RepID=A0A7C9MDS9_9RHOB|nr:DUF2125 domain-containing protein [Kangsaoukella pontilimi]MXQ08491.1 DUF2125 domain-containing protein [Kangsaoukella pontilimi]